MEEFYSKSITDKFLNRYKELELLATNENKKYTYLVNKYRREYEMLRHIRNELAHNSVNCSYPFIVSKDVLMILENMLNEVKDKAFVHAKTDKQIIAVNYDMTIDEVIMLMSKHNYSYLPILDEFGVVKGIVSSDAIMNIISTRSITNLKMNDKISKYVSKFSIEFGNTFYLFIDKEMFVYELDDLVDNYQHNKAKLGIILITENGKKNEKLLGLITPWDLLKMQ